MSLRLVTCPHCQNNLTWANFHRLDQCPHSRRRLNAAPATTEQDQVRLRGNLKEMPPTAGAYKRYLQKFDDQETEIEQRRAIIKNLQNTEHQQRLALDAYLTNLTVGEPVPQGSR